MWTGKENKVGHIVSLKNSSEGVNYSLEPYIPVSIQNFCGPSTLAYPQVAVVSPALHLYVSASGINLYLPQMIYLYHSNSVSSLNFLLLTATFLAQENSLLSCIIIFSWYIK